MYNSYGFEPAKNTYKPDIKEDKEVKTRSAVNIGTVSMMMVFIGLCLVVLSALCLASARGDYALSVKMANHNNEYYEAYNILVDMASEASAGAQIETAVNDYQQLKATVGKDNRLEDIRVENIDLWESDLSLPVMQ